jgi:iron complex outermembrane receptor protein
MSCLVATAPPPAAAEGTGVIEGVVTVPTGEPLAGAEAVLIDLNRRTKTDATGTFRFEDVPPGRYLIEVVSRTAGSSITQVEVIAGQTARATMTIDLTVHHEDVVVSATPYGREASSLARPVAVIDGVDLQGEIQPTLGETLARESGVSSTSYSPGASRPVIRGQGGDRIRILEEGIGVGDASNVSEDHAVAFDPLGAERIEIVRGPATLLYGSNAVGGLVNVIDSRIPDHVPDTPVEGIAEVRYGSNAEDGAAALALTGGGKRFAWHADALARDSGDAETPEGTLVNSDIDSAHGTLGASWVAEKGYAGVSFGSFNTEYGIPNPAEPVRIDMMQDRWDFKGAYTEPLGIFRGIKVRFGTTDYEHAEVEDTGEVGNRFFNKAWEGRVELNHKQAGRFTGAFGMQISERDFEAVGEEAFVPPTLTQNRALFAVEEIAAGDVTFDLGLRYEDQDNEASDPLLPQRSFNGLSASAGAVWNLPHACSLAFTAASSSRLPSAEELYANGPHLATFQFQVGDPTLDKETGLGFDLAFRRGEGKVTGEVSLFTHDFDKYIFLSPTGNFVDVDGELLPEFMYVQTDASFRGAEARIDFELMHLEPHHLELELSGDMVRAEEDASGQPLPFIPPYRAAVGLHYRGQRLWGYVEGRWTDGQDRVAAFETPTEGYTWLNASLGWRVVGAGAVHDFILRGLNLTDRLSRNHISALKDIVPLPGRDLSLSYRITF